MKKNHLVLKIVLLLAVVCGVYAGVTLFHRIYEPALVTIEPEIPAGWTRATNDQGMSFAYPEALGTQYVRSAEWPPRVEILQGEYECAIDSTSSSTPALPTEERSIDGRSYCVTRSGEGAAGSTYITYEYKTNQKDAVLRTTFTLRFVQCENYDEPNRSACKTEQGTYDVDALAVSIIKSVPFSN